MLAAPAVIREVFSTPPPTCPAEAVTLIHVAQTYHDGGFYDDALQSYHLALEQWPGAREDDRVWVRLCVGSVYESMGDDANAMSEYSQASAETTTPLLKATALSCCASVYHHTKVFDQANALFEEALQTRLAFDAIPLDISGAENNLAATVYSQGDVARSIQLFTNALHRLREAVGLDHPRTGIVQRNVDMVKKHELQHMTFKGPEIKSITIPKGMMAQAKASKGKKGGKKKGGKKKKK
jgi:tetratricopeptide (TPR) repeat protein